MSASPATEHPAGELVIGIDVGTTTTKAALFALDDTRGPVAVARVASTTRSPRPGWSEAEPAAVLDAVREAVRTCVDEVDAGAVTAVGITGTACGAWLVDADGDPVRDAVLWNDGRAAGILAEWRRDGVLDVLVERGGNALMPGFTLPVLAWLAEHEPDVLDVASVVLCCKDVVRAWLTGERASEATDASYVPFDVAARRWDDEMLAVTGLDPLHHLLPPLRPEDATAPLLDDVATQLGLPPGIPVGVGATDIVAGCVGGGAVEVGRAVTILGTSANTSVVTGDAHTEPRGVGLTAAAPRGRWVRTMVNTSGATTLDWAAGLLTGGDVAALVELAGTADPDDVPVLVPYLAETGVVSPVVAPDAAGGFVGLRAHHGPAALARAVLEGLAHAVADGVAALPVALERVTAVGGAARAELVLQLLADATGATVVRPSGEELGARGAAVLAAAAAGAIDVDVAATDLEEDLVVQPDQARGGERLARYQRARDLVLEWRGA